MSTRQVPTVGLDDVLGLELGELTADRVTATLTVQPHLCDESGALHRGVVSSAVETAGSVAAALWYGERGRVVGVANSTSHFSPVHAGTLTVVATPLDRQDDRQLWAVAVRDSGDRMVAHGELHVANVRAPAGASQGHPAFDEPVRPTAG